MKKSLKTIVLVAGAFIFSSQLSAQNQPVTYGIKAGTSYSGYRLGGDKDLKSKMNIGGSFGGFVKYEITENFALQSGIDVYYRVSELESKTDKLSGKFKSFGIEVPLYGILQGDLGSGKAFIGAGPYVGYGISAKSDGINLFKKNKETGQTSMNRLDFGAGGIIGYNFNKNWQINANYQFGLADLYKEKESSMKSNVITVGLVHIF